MLEMQAVEKIGAFFPFFPGVLLDGEQIRDYIRHAYTHGLYVDLQVDDKSYKTIFEDKKPKFLGAKDKDLEDMLPVSEPHPHFIRVDIYHGSNLIKQIFYDPGDGKYRVF